MDANEDYLGRWNDPAYARNYSIFTKDQQVDAGKYIDQLEVDRNSIVVDLGCGEAKFLAAIASGIRKGIGIDASVHMLASAQAVSFDWRMTRSTSRRRSSRRMSPKS